MTEPTFNPYAPPVTSEAQGKERPPPHHRPARLLWPLYLLTLLRSTAAWTLIQHSFRDLHTRFGIEATGNVIAYSSLGAGLVAAPVVGLLGDRRPARLVLILAMVLAMLAMLATPPPAALGSLALTAVVMWIGRLGNIGAGLVETGYALRATTVRGVYLSVLLLEIVRNAGGAVASNGQALVPTIRPALLLSAGLTFLAALLVVGVRRPADATLAGDVPDPLSREPLSTGASVGLVTLLAGFVVLYSILELHTPRLTLHSGGQGDYFEHLHYVGALPGLVLPFLAFRYGWRPRPLVVAGILVTAAGGLVTATSALASRVVLVASVGRVVTTLGYQALFDTAVLPLLRQCVPLTRVALWYAAYSLAWTLLRVALTLPGYWVDSAVFHVVGAAALLPVVALGLLRLTRGR